MFLRTFCKAKHYRGYKNLNYFFKKLNKLKITNFDVDLVSVTTFIKH